MIPIINYRVLLIPLFFFLACSAPEREKIDVMTFNIRFENPGDGMFSWDSRREMVFWLIEKYDPDILGIQEALENQVLELDTTLSAYSWMGVGREDGECLGEYVPVFYKKERFALAEEGHFWLSESPAEPGSMGWDAACTRMVSWIKLKEVSSGYEYYVFNTHFDHVGEQARINSARLLRDSIRHIASLHPVIIMGDFNAPPDSDPLNILAELFSDARVLAVKKDSLAATTYVGFPADLTRTDIIDHILISPHFSVEEYEIISDNAGGFFPSDHLPVRASLSLKMP